MIRPPLHLSSSFVSLLFLAYLAGTLSSTLAGRAADRFGRRNVLCGSILISTAGLLMTLPDQLACITVGLVVFTAGFFAAHSVASGWIAARPSGNRAQASALYLMAYYLGSSILGSSIGWVFLRGGWPTTVLVIAAASTVALFCCATVSTR